MSDRTKRIIGIAFSVLVILFMLFDAISKLFQPEAVVQATTDLGFGQHHVPILGSIGLLVTILYIIPRTSLIGAILLTAYFGGAMAINLRVDAPLFSHILFPVYLSVFMWGGLFLRFPQLPSTLLMKRS